jgi:Saxitoxin biosynthesis operon protein SxtJ
MAHMSHEDLSREQQVEGSSDRAFGLVFAAVFLLIAIWPLFYRETPRWWSAGVAALFAVIALSKPALLAYPNRQWTKLGVLLGKVVSPIALGILFYGVITPIGIAMRLAGKDPLRLKLGPGPGSYWILRKPPGPPPDSMTNQF